MPSFRARAHCIKQGSLPGQTSEAKAHLNKKISPQQAQGETEIRLPQGVRKEKVGMKLTALSLSRARASRLRTLFIKSIGFLKGKIENRRQGKGTESRKTGRIICSYEFTPS